MRYVSVLVSNLITSQISYTGLCRKIPNKTYSEVTNTLHTRRKALLKMVSEVKNEQTNMNDTTNNYNITKMLHCKLNDDLDKQKKHTK